jgi:hypothetical protein
VHLAHPKGLLAVGPIRSAAAAAAGTEAAAAGKRCEGGPRRWAVLLPACGGKGRQGAVHPNPLIQALAAAPPEEGCLLVPGPTQGPLGLALLLVLLGGSCSAGALARLRCASRAAGERLWLRQTRLCPAKRTASCPVCRCLLSCQQPAQKRSQHSTRRHITTHHNKHSTVTLNQQAYAYTHRRCTHSAEQRSAFS